MQAASESWLTRIVQAMSHFSFRIFPYSEIWSLKMVKDMSVRISLGLVALLLGGCGGAEKFPLVEVTGLVTCNGMPVPKAMVYFEPVRSGETATIGKQGFALTDDQGRFVVSTYGDGDGAVVGKHLIRVGKSESSPPCDCALNSMTVLQEVQVGGEEPMEFTFELPKKSRQNRDEMLELDDEDE